MGKDVIYLVLYVDDLLIVGMKQESIQTLKRKLSRIFEMTDCGELNHFLGMKISYDRGAGRMQLSQIASIEKILQKFGMADCNPTKTPMEKKVQLDRHVTETVGEPYRWAV